MNFPITAHDWKTCRAKRHPVQTKPEANPESPNRLPTGGRGFKPRQTLQSFSDLFAAAAAAKLLQSCPTLCDPIDGSPPGSAVPGIHQARTLECVAISFSSA